MFRLSSRLAVLLVAVALAIPLAYTALTRYVAHPTMPCTPAAQAPGGQVAALINAVEQGTEQVRGLHAHQPVPVSLLDAAGFKKLVACTFDHAAAGDDTRAGTQALTLLGILPRHADLTRLLRAEQTDEVIGYYVPRLKHMYVLAHTDGLSLYDQDVLSHEYTHALQDQAFDLVRVRAHGKGLHNSDRDLAVTALIEGDATEEQLLYAQTEFSPTGYIQFQDEARQLDSGAAGDATPGFLLDQSLFPYIEGRAFEQSLVRQTATGADFTAVDRAFHRPPVSTREILHPDVYLQDPAAPAPDLVPPHPTLPRGWRRVDSDVVGEYGLQDMLARGGLDATSAATAADGWRADRYSLFDHGRDFLLAWQLRTDAPASAVTLAGALATYLNAHFHTALVPDDAGLQGGTAAAQPDEGMAVQVAGPDVLVVLASRGGLMPEARRALASIVPRPRAVVVRAGAWTQLTPLPRALDRPAVAVGHDGNIYVFGGTDNNGHEFNTTYIYHPRSDGWTRGADMPTAREGARAVTLPDGRIVVLGGGTHCATNLCSDGSVYNTVEAYSPATNSWSTLARMSSPRYRFAAVLYHARIYALGGSNGQATLSSVEVYDPHSASWSPDMDLPQPAEALAAAVDPATDRIYVSGGLSTTLQEDPVGGAGGGTVNNTLYVYDGSTWRVGAAMPQASEDHASTVGPDGRIYVMGGFDAGWLTAVQAYDPGANSWSSAPSLPAPLCCMGAVTVNGLLYSIGGNGANAQVAAYRPVAAAVTPGTTPLAPPDLPTAAVTPTAVPTSTPVPASTLPLTPTAVTAITSTTGIIPTVTVPSPAVASAWQIHTPFPRMRDRPAVAVGHDGNIYVFGGMDNANGYNVFNTTLIYHPRSGTWTRGADMAVAREGAQAVTLPDGRIAVLGGSPGCPNSSSAQLCFATNRVDVYDPRTDSWGRLAPMSTPRYRFNAVWRDGQIYAIGGLDGTQPLASVEAYDPRTNRWHPVASLPQVTEGAAAAVDAHGAIYVLGGAPAAMPIYNTLYIYNGGTWTAGASMPQATQDYAAVYGPDGKIYALGGWNNADLTTVQVYDPRTNTWSIGPSLPVPLCCMGAVTVRDGTIYSIGGDGTLAQVIVYHSTVR